MRVPQSGLNIDSPAWPLLQSQVSYWGITDGVVDPFGIAFQCAGLANEPVYTGQSVKILSGPSAGQVRPIALHLATDVEVTHAFTDNTGAAQQIDNGTRFCILSAMDGGAAPVAPSIGLWMFGVCEPGMPPSTTNFTMHNLAGFPNDIFNDEFWMQVIHNDDAPGTAPEREIRRITNYNTVGGFFTDAFSSNLEENDIVAIFHESIMSIEILGFGTLTASSQTVPADNLRAGVYAWENNDYYKGCILMPTEGNCRFQPRPIGGFTMAGGIFTLDEPFSQLPGLVDYVIIGGAYPVQRLLDIFNIVNAILMTTETGGTIQTDGTEQNVYINNAPAGVYEPRKVKIDFSVFVRGAENHGSQATETIVVRTYYRIYPGGNLILQDEQPFAGVQDPPLKKIDLDENRYGIQVTMQRIAGNARYYDWEVIYRG